jgi:hypothetical protein
MLPISRYRQVVVFTAIFLSVGCTSTSPAPELIAQDGRKPVVETSGSDAVAPRLAP